MSKSNQIKLGALISYIGIIFNISIGFIFTPWLVREIGQSDYGLYTLAMSVVSFFIMDFGISGAISRFISVYRAKGDEKSIDNLLGNICKLYLLMDVIIFAVLIIIFFSIDSIFTQFTVDEINKLKIVFAIVGGFSVISFPLMPLNGILISYEKFVPLKLLDLIQKIASVLFVVIAVSIGFGLYTVVLINTLTNIVINILKLIYIKKSTKIKVNIKNNDLSLLKQIFSFSIWTTIISVAQRLIINISPTIIGVFCGAIDVSIFSIGVTLEGYTFTFASALNGLFLPKVTKLALKSDDISEITQLMIKVGRLQLCVIGIIVIGLTSMGKEFIGLWMGNDFKDSYYVSILLILPGIVTLTQEIALNYLVAINAIKYRAYDFIVASIISIILSLLLTPMYGAIGAALSAFIGIIVGHVIIMNIIYYKVFKIDIITFFKECHLKLSIPMILTFGIATLIQKYILTDNIMIFFIKVVFIVIIYSTFMWLLGLNRYEKDLFKSILKPMINKKNKKREISNYV